MNALQSCSSTDNTGLPARVADVNIATGGASHVGVYRAGRGEIDSVLWVAHQFGDWYGDDHRATSALAEGGYRWSSSWRPWIRAGLVHAAGDTDPADFRHGTFFPMLPSTSPSLLAGTYAQMNLRDAFAQLRLRPHARIGVSTEVHHVSLATAADR